MSSIYVVETGLFSATGAPVTKVGVMKQASHIIKRYRTYYPSPVVRRIIDIAEATKPIRTERRLHRCLRKQFTGSGRETYFASWQDISNVIDKVLTADGKIRPWLSLDTLDTVDRAMFVKHGGVSVDVVARPPLRKDAIVRLLIEHPDWPYAVVARTVGVSREYVRQVSNELDKTKVLDGPKS